MLALPVPAPVRVTSTYQSLRGNARHGAVDFAVPVGTDVRAVYGGEVVSAQDTAPNAAGLMMVIKHATPLGEVFSRYLHLSEFVAAPGAHVDAGDVIAKSGESGANAPHLHLDALADKDGAAHKNYVTYLGTPAGGFVLHSSGRVKLPLEPLLDIESPGVPLQPKGPPWLLLAILYLLFSRD